MASHVPPRVPRAAPSLAVHREARQNVTRVTRKCVARRSVTIKQAGMLKTACAASASVRSMPARVATSAVTGGVSSSSLSLRKQRTWQRSRTNHPAMI